MIKKYPVMITLSLVLLLGVGIGVHADSALQEIQAYLNSEIKFKLNGADWTPKNVDGQSMTPITYDGTTYVPLRAVSDALKVSVNYDESTKTVLLGEKADSAPIFAKDYTFLPGSGDITETKKSTEKIDLTFFGKTYPETYVSRVATVINLSPGKKYQTATLDIAINARGMLKVTGDDGAVLKSAELVSDKLNSVKVNVGSQVNVKVEIMSTNSSKIWILPSSVYK